MHNTAKNMQPSQAQVKRAKRGAACKDCFRRKRKCSHVETGADQKTSKGQELYITLLHVPICGETKLCSEFVDAMLGLRLEHTWLRMVACRLGNDDVVDLAATAVIRNAHLALQTERVNVAGSLQNYVKSVEVLRIAIKTRENNLSDQILMSVALLCVCESLMRSELFTCFAHWGAMATILTSRPSSWQPSELSRAILYHMRNQTFHIPCARGQISPFDEPRWYTLEPPGIASLPPETVRLKRLSNELQIRLPKLILLLRKLRAGIDEETSKQAIDLSLELSQLTDENAESKMLHRIKVVKTVSSIDAKFVPFSFEYADLGELEGAVVYWKFHLFFAHIQLKLLRIFPNIAFNATKIRADMARWGINAMMSLQYAANRQQYAHARGMVAMPTALVAMWSLWDLDEDFRGIPAKWWRAWNRDRVNDALEAWQVRVTNEDLDVTSNLLAGGPLEGIFVAAYVPFLEIAAEGVC